MNKLELLKALGIEVPKEIYECEINFKSNSCEGETRVKIEGSSIAIRFGLLAIINAIVKRGIFKDLDEIINDYNMIFGEEEKKNDK